MPDRPPRSLRARLRLPASLARRLDRLPDAADGLVATPGRRRAVTTVAAALLAGAVGMLAVWLTARIVPAAPLRIAFDVAVVAGALALWRRLDHTFGELPEPMPAVLWQVACVSTAFAAFAYGAEWLLLPEGVDDTALLVAGRWPPSLAGAVVGVVVAASGTIAAAFALHRLRALTYATPRRSVRRSWAVMLAAFALQAVAESPEFGRAGESAGNVLEVLAVLAMLWNAAQQAWIVRLRQRDKWAAIALGIVLIGTAIVAAAAASLLSAVVSPSLTSLLPCVFIYAAFVGTTVTLYALFLLPATDAYQRQAEERRALRGLADLMADAFDRERLSAAIAHAPVAAGLADRAWLVLGAGADGEVTAAHGLALADARARTTPTLLDSARWRGPSAAATLLSLPLVAQGQVVGALVAERTRDAFFTRDDAESLGVFAAQAALAFDHARLFEQTVERERLRREMDIARSVQQRLLPATLPTLPGLSISATSVPALDVGGDYYDVVRAGESRLAVVVADVSGKGTSAAFFMAEMQGAVRALAPRATDPVAFLGEANRVLASVLDTGSFVTALFGLLDVQPTETPGEAPSVTFTSARAGHCPLAVVPADASRPVRLVRSAGLGLGLDRRGAAFARLTAAETTTLGRGDALVLVTDGVVESRAPSGEEYGYERLSAALTAARARGLAGDALALRDALLADLDAFLDGETYADDMTVLAMCWQGVEVPVAPAVGTRAAEPASAGGLVAGPRAGLPATAA